MTRRAAREAEFNAAALILQAMSAEGQSAEGQAR
jgi:hypothetical protein